MLGFAEQGKEYWHWIYERVRRQLWWRAVAYGIAGMLTAVLALVAERIFPWEIPFNLTPDAVDSLFNIIASSMLAVTTFSLAHPWSGADRRGPAAGRPCR